MKGALDEGNTFFLFLSCIAIFFSSWVTNTNSFYARAFVDSPSNYALSISNERREAEPHKKGQSIEGAARCKTPAQQP